MSQNTYCEPKIYIGDVNITEFESFKINEPGSNQVNQLDMQISDVLLNKSKLLNEEVKVYLNYGAEDSSPIFRGFIKQVIPSNSILKIRAVDPRGLLTGTEGFVFSSTDELNYDGYTVTQFLHKFITDKVNEHKTYIGLDALTESEPAVLMKGVRGKNLSVYSTVRKQVEEKIDDSDLETLKSFAIGIVEDGKKSNICIYKKQSITGAPSLYLNYFDGIKDMTYKERMPSSIIKTSSKDYQGEFKRGNLSSGPSTKSIKGDYTSNAHASYIAFLKHEEESEDVYEITINATKGYYTGIDSIVHIETDDTNVSGNYRLVSKSISFAKSNISCSLGFNKKPIRMSDFVQ